jgi:hypothetical protein
MWRDGETSGVDLPDAPGGVAEPTDMRPLG